MAHRLLLDTSSLAYRAFFALPTSIRNADGQPVNALHGYLDMTARLVADHHPDEVVHAFDADWRPAPRVAAYAGYKSQRAADPEGLPEQFPVLREVLDALGAVSAEAPGWEADDALATLATQAAEGDIVEVVTGDRDLLQLVRDAAPGGPCVRVLFTVRGVSQLSRFDEAAVTAKYGIPAARYADFASLRGDPSDGLPGVAGVGEKTARDLVVAHPSLAAVLEDTGHKPRLRAALDQARGYLAAMDDVVPVRRNVAVSLRRPPGDDALLLELAERWRLAGPIRRLREALDATLATTLPDENTPVEVDGIPPHAP